MPNIARTNKRSQPPIAASAAKTKILLVRQPVKSVRQTDQPDRTALHLAIGVIAAMGVVAAIWLLGFLGFQLGFAHMMRVPDLQVETGGGLATGTLMLIGLPRVILQAGIAEPGWLMVAFVMIAIPGASLGAIKPHTAGGPRPKQAFIVLSFTGAIVACLNAVALIWWTISPMRMQYIAEIPADPSLAIKWLESLQTVAGLDALAVMAAAVWVVVVMRVAIPRWLRGLAASACFFTMVVVSVAMAMTNAAVAQIGLDRSVIYLDEGSGQPRLLLGSTQHQIATLSVDHMQRLGSTGGSAAEFISIVELSDRPSKLTVIQQQNLVDYLLEQAPKQP
jgi:hypothetical protein